MSINRQSRSVDTLIIGNGPSALILSYILHGNSPFITESHPDLILNSKLKKDLLQSLDVPDLTSHFSTSSYSTSTLPVNALLDALLRPHGDTNPEEYKSCIEWRKTDRSISHVLLAETYPGGQWNKLGTPGPHIGTLSYVDQLSLPEYTLRDHLGCDGFMRPTKHQVAKYLEQWPEKVGISDAIEPPNPVWGVKRTENGFYIESHHFYCKRLILATGIFSQLILPPPLLRGLKCTAGKPVLIVGSGFSAADAIITNIPKVQVIHVFKWNPERLPPLHMCHKDAYPDYAGVYKNMKRAVRGQTTESYEGYPNAIITSTLSGIKLQLEDGRIIEKEISDMMYLVGRKGSLACLKPQLRQEILGTTKPIVNKMSLRSKVEKDFEVAPGVFVIGSLTGDSLLRHSYGSCVTVAKELLDTQELPEQQEKPSKGCILF
jgi:hypothetical protein